MNATQGTDKIVLMACCGARYATVMETAGHTCPTEVVDEALFSRIAELEDNLSRMKWHANAVRSGLITSAYQGGFAQDKFAEAEEGNAKRLREGQAELFAMVDDLTADQRAAYGEFRKARMN